MYGKWIKTLHFISLKLALQCALADIKNDPIYNASPFARNVKCSFVNKIPQFRD